MAIRLMTGLKVFASLRAPRMIYLSRASHVPLGGAGLRLDPKLRVNGLLEMRGIKHPGVRRECISDRSPRVHQAD
jgi:hypothetical protein